MAEDVIPPYYEVARLLFRDREDTLKACVKYRSTPAPDMSLAWLRNAAYQVLSGQITLAALLNTIEMKVPPNARQSIRAAVERLIAFAIEMDWVGERLPDFTLEVGRGYTMQVVSVGRFSSPRGRWVVGLQPRLDNAPSLEWQIETWLSFLNEAYCADPLAPATPLILDVSRNPLTGLRGFHAVDPAVVKILSKSELDARMDQFLDCYEEAKKIIPVRPKKSRRSKKEDDTRPPLPGF